MTQTLLDFWNSNSIRSIFVVGAGCPAGKKYIRNLTAEGEDYCDLNELIDNGLFAQPEDGSRPWWDLNGVVQDKVWTWSGEGSAHDCLGNDYWKITVRCN